MADKTIKPTAWRQLYEIAVLENDPSRIGGRIVDARHAILDRVEELLTCSPSAEHRDLNDAFLHLRDHSANTVSISKT